MSPKAKGTISLLLSAAAFGLMPLLALKIYEQGGNSLFLSLCRFAFSIPVLFLAARREPHSCEQSIRYNGRFAFIAAVYIATPLLLFVSYSYIASSLATTIHYAYPALVLLLCQLCFHQKVPFFKYCCCMVCLAGVCCLCLSDTVLHPTGAFLSFASAVTYSLYVVCLPRSGLQQRFSPFSLTLRLNIAGTAALLVLNGALHTWAFSMSVVGWLYTVLISWGTAVGATVLFQTGLKLCGSENAALLSTFEPLVSVAAGIFLLGEPSSPRTVLGIILVLAAVTALSAYEKLKSRRSHAFSSSEQQAAHSASQDAESENPPSGSA